MGRLRCSEACGIFPDGIYLCPQSALADGFLPPGHQGGPVLITLTSSLYPLALRAEVASCVVATSIIFRILFVPV